MSEEKIPNTTCLLCFLNKDRNLSSKYPNHFSTCDRCGEIKCDKCVTFGGPRCVISQGVVCNDCFFSHYCNSCSYSGKNPDHESEPPVVKCQGFSWESKGKDLTKKDCNTKLCLQCQHQCKKCSKVFCSQHFIDCDECEQMSNIPVMDKHEWHHPSDGDNLCLSCSREREPSSEDESE